MDEVLAREPIRGFDGRLVALEVHCALAETLAAAEDSAGRVDCNAGSRKAERVEHLAALRQGKLGTIFHRAVDELEGLLDGGKWEEARALIERLRQHSRERDDNHLRTLLGDPSLDGFGAWAASWFVPALRAMRALRTESIYHLAMAELLSFERTAGSSCEGDPGSEVRQWLRSSRRRPHLP